MHICTIVARNYLPGARILATSFREHHPTGRVSVLVLDDPYGEVTSDVEPFEVVRLADLPEPLEELHRMAVLYDVTEFATAMKPWLLEALLDRGSENVLYLDPDIQVFDALDDLGELARLHGIVLTPHFTAPVPRDHLKTDETSILAAGIYNLGFIGVGQSSRAFLDFWKQRLRRECRIDPINMRFVDQRWVDFVPGMFDHVISRDPTINVAYWNLHHRHVNWTGERYEVDGAPLRFFHFSGYSPDAPYLLSKHQGDQPRILLSERPDVARLCSDYGKLLVANGYEASRSASYGFSRMANGVPIDSFVRTLYRAKVDRAEELGEEMPPDPFDAAGAQALVAWLNRAGAADFGPERLSLYQAALYTHTPELRHTIKDPQGAEHDAFLAWVDGQVAAGRYHPLLVPTPPLEPPDRALQSNASTSRDDPLNVRNAMRRGWPDPARLRPGINLCGYLRAELGIGEAGRLLLTAIERAEIPNATLVYDDTLSRQTHPFVAPNASEPVFDTNFLVINADQIPMFAQLVGPGFFAGRHTVASWAWELEDFPTEFRPAFDYVDEIWAPSEFTQRAIKAVTDKPVFVLPYPVVTPAPGPVGRADLGLPADAFVFLFCFDMFSSMERKNPIGLVDAFCRAFSPGEGPVLVLKAINGQKRRREVEMLRWACRGRDDILIIDKYLPAGENAALMATADCYVSLHRSEGFGLTMAEAMALGKPVIATAYSGNMDFMTPETGYLVSWKYTTVSPEAGPYNQGCQWADPDLDEAAGLMRAVVHDPDEARHRGELGRRWVLEHHSADQRVAFLRERFDWLHGAPGRLGTTQTVARGVDDTARDPGLSSLTRLARARPNLEGPSKLGSSGRLLRRVVARALRRSEDHQHAINVAMATELDALRAVTSALSAQKASNTAELDSVLRDQAKQLSSTRARTADLESRADVLQTEMRPIVEAYHQLYARPYMADTGLFDTLDADGRPALGYRDGPEADETSFREFEEIFRGSEDTIRDSLRLYVRVLEHAEPVVDLGCGRGEMLDLLRDAGLHAEGVDFDESMVRRSRSKGHTVHQEDGIAFLERQVDESLGAVFTAQVVEHLTPGQLTELIRQARRVLRPGGLLVMETVNPHCLQAFKTFWTDLTHRGPIFPEVLLSYCRGTFEEATTVFPNGSGDLEADLRNCGQFAVVARKKPEVTGRGTDRA